MIKTKYLKGISQRIIYMTISFMGMIFGFFCGLGYFSIFFTVLGIISGITLSDYIDTKDSDESRTRYIVYIVVNVIICIIAIIYFIWTGILGILPSNIEIVIVF